MVRECRTEMICDLAETYHIFDYRQVRPMLLATLVIGLRADSRVKMHYSGSRLPANTTLMAMMFDQLSTLVWLHTEDARRKRNRPKSLLNELLAKNKESDIISFDSGEEFDCARAAIIKRGG